MEFKRSKSERLLRRIFTKQLPPDMVFPVVGTNEQRCGRVAEIFTVCVKQIVFLFREERALFEKRRNTK